MAASPITPNMPLSTITNRDDAEYFLSSISQLIESLELLLDQETSLIRASKLLEAGQMVGDKSRLYVEYVRALEKMRTEREALSVLSPAQLQGLRDQHSRLQNTLAINLAVLGTAKAVSEDIIRTVANDVTASTRPQGYNDRGNTYGKKQSPNPISVSELF